MAKAKSEESNMDIVPVVTLTPAERAELLGEKGWEVAPQVVSLDVGEMIQGKLEGPGDKIKYTDTASGEEKELDSWIIDCGDGVKAQLMSSHQLDKELPSFVGREVRIIKGESKRVKGKQINVFIVQARAAK